MPCLLSAANVANVDIEAHGSMLQHVVSKFMCRREPLDVMVTLRRYQHPSRIRRRHIGSEQPFQWTKQHRDLKRLDSSKDVHRAAAVHKPISYAKRMVEFGCARYTRKDGVALSHCRRPLVVSAASRTQ